MIKIYLTTCLTLCVGAILFGQAPPVPVYNSNTPVNFVRSWEAKAPVTDVSSLVQGNLLKTREVTQYFDGLGRPLQTVVKQGALATTTVSNVYTDLGNARDLVTPVLYDGFGRESYRFSPYAAGTADGQFKTNPIADHQSFMGTQYNSQGENNYYSQTLFENSPLNRVQEQFAPGVSWAGTATQSDEANRKGIKTKYWFNTPQDDVQIWSIVDDENPTTWGLYTKTGTYAAGELYKTVTVDERGKQVIEFKDKDGQVILKKVQLTAAAETATSNGSNHSGWMCTYYIYDDLGNLRCVIQPEGVKTLSTTGWYLTYALLAEQCFRYEYDHRQRMIMKKVPGAAEVYMVYDTRNRLVMTQDGNMRYQGQWLYTRYDELNRPKATGMLVSSFQFSHHLTLAASNPEYPANWMLSGVEPYTETFYDDYSWLSGFSNLPAGFTAGYNNIHETHLLASNNNYPYAQQLAADMRTKGMVTGTRVKVLEDPNNTYIYTLTLYDNKGRAVQTKTVNHVGGVDLATTQYSWSGQMLVTASTQSNVAAATSVTTVTKYAYDALGRLVQTSQNMINEGTLVASGEKIVSQNYYDELGQLATKKLGVNGNTALETQNYEYNVRGWLLGMNKEYVKNTTSNNYFGFELNYDKPGYFGSSNNEHLYNGNIAGMSWRGKEHGGQIRRYDYRYDAANRLMNALYTEVSGNGFAANPTRDFSSMMGDGNPLNPGSAYDLNGNILAMTQKGLYNDAPVTIDQLSYSYMPGSNKLLKVTDEQKTQYNLGDFHDGTNNYGNNDYSYDENGNMLTDLNKGIYGNIQYNHLNLPKRVQVNGKGNIEYVYDATGNKLAKKVTATGQPQKVTQYLGGMIFESNVLQHVPMEEGRVRLESGVWKFDYFLKDHLGNVRAMVADNGTLLEETHYYPFGLQMKGISTQQAGVLANRYKYNGIEQTEDLGLNQYDAFYRNLDPQIARFWQIDPETEAQESFSPYESMGNNPVSNVDPLGDFKTRFGAWWHRLWNQGDWRGADIDQNQYGEWYLFKVGSYDGENAGVAVKVFYGEGRNAYSTAAEAMVRDEEIAMDIWKRGGTMLEDGSVTSGNSTSEYQLYDSPKEAGMAALGIGTGVVLPNFIFKSATGVVNAAKTAGPLSFTEVQALTRTYSIELNIFFKSGGVKTASKEALLAYKELATRILNGTGGAPATKLTEKALKVQSHRLEMINEALKTLK